MNWDNPQLVQSLRELEETIFLQGRDSRIVRGTFVYSRWKKKILNACKQKIYGLFEKCPKPAQQLRVFFWLPGGLGDVACSRRLVSAYQALLPHAQFEIYNPIPGVVETVFGDFSNLKIATSSKRYWKNYDLVVLSCLSAKFLAADEVRLQHLAPQFIPVYQKAKAAQKKLGFLLEDPFLTEAYMGRWLLKEGGRRFDLLSFTGGVNLAQDAQEKISVSVEDLSKWHLVAKQYITFHDGSISSQKLPTRMWPKAYWKELLQHIKQTFPQFKIVQLGTPDNPTYEEADVCLLGKTQLTDLPTLLEGSRLHIDSESGLVHLAQYVSVPSIVLFGPSDVSFFGYTKNKNLACGNCGGCMWMTIDWMTRCPLHKSEAVCMQALTPAIVWPEVRALLEKLN